VVKFLVDETKTVAPKRAAKDAGFDFFVPRHSDEFQADFNAKNSVKKCKYDSTMGIMIPSGEDALIPSFVKVELPSDEVLVAFNKSGVATKQRLDVGACVVDPSYQGQIHLHVVNTSNESQVVSFGQKIVQFVPLKFDSDEAKAFTTTAITEEEFFSEETSRGDGGFGSTGLT
jgi:dUTP pyrophosphatase